MSAAGLRDVRQRLSKLKQQGVKPSIAADIWSDSSISLLGTMVYYIDENWEERFCLAAMDLQDSGTLVMPYENRQKMTWKMLD